MSLSSWDDEYARLARAVSQVRTAGGAMVGANRQHQIGAVRSGLDRIGADLRAIEAGRAAPPPEIGRRRALIEGLRAAAASNTASNSGWRVLTQPGNSDGGAPPPPPGAYVFHCSSETEAECLDRRLLGCSYAMRGKVRGAASL